MRAYPTPKLSVSSSSGSWEQVEHYVPPLGRVILRPSPTHVLKGTVHLQKNVKQIIFKQILLLRCEE